jgi:ribosomal protein S18 acetylase RimI-like enzyme
MSTKTAIRKDDDAGHEKSCQNTVTITPIEHQDLRAVAEIHRRAFPDSALTQLGLEAVRRYYQWQLDGPHEHRFLGALSGHALRGYAIGGKSRGALSGFVRKNKYYLAFCLLLHPLVLLTDQGRTAIGTAARVFRGRKRKLDAQAALVPTQLSFGMLAIAVDAKLQSQGIGKLLMAAMEKAATSGGYCKMHLTVRVTNQKAIAFYERLGWFKSKAGSAWRGGMEKILTQE